MLAMQKQKKADLNEALAQARAAVWEEAKKLRELFGGHSEQYYFQQIVQLGRLEKTTQKVNHFTAYIRSEVKRINEGKGSTFQ